MNVSLAAIRSRLLDLRSWDSTGDALNKRIKEALNLALDRLAGDVPEALLPDDEHVVVLKDEKAEDASVDARIKVFNADGAGVTGTDKIVMVFTDTAGAGIGDASSLTTWRPVFTGEWDAIMHLEITDPNGLVHRRQSREWFTYKDSSDVLWYAVTIDRPWVNNTDSLMKFRIFQPEFFFRDDVMELLEPARIYDSSRQQVWAVDTAGAYRQDMVDFQGNTKGRPIRMFRGRHFQLPAPTEAPQVFEASQTETATKAVSTTDAEISTTHEAGLVGLEGKKALSSAGVPKSAPPVIVGLTESSQRASIVADQTIDLRTGMPMASSTADSGTNPWSSGTNYDDGSPNVDVPPKQPIPEDTPEPSKRPTMAKFQWHEDNALRSGTWGICYTYVWGRREISWQQSPLVTPGGHDVLDNDDKLTWCYEPTAPSVTGVNRYGGMHDPTFESAPSPVAVLTQSVGGALVLSATNLDAMLGFGDSTMKRYGHTGMRIRYYVTHLAATGDHGDFTGIETNQRYYLLCEVEPTFDHVAELELAGIGIPDGVTASSKYGSIKSARVVWNGDQLFDYHRPLRHSTGYYAWSVYPHQDARYELDLRVLRLPRKYIDDQDTAPIQRDAVPALIELALHYVSLLDGNDQVGAVQHLARYQELVRLYRQKYGNPGGIVEPVPLTGYAKRHRYGTYSDVSLDD